MKQSIFAVPLALLLTSVGTHAAVIEKQSLTGHWSNSGGQSQSAATNPVVNLSLSTDATVQFDLSSEVDSVLYLQDEQGNLLAQDDNSGGNLNARIQMQLSVGNYKLVAGTHHSNQSGDFVLASTHGSMQFAELIDVQSINSFHWIYNDSGTGADDDFSIWRPNTDAYPGYYSLGDIGVSHHGAPGSTYIVKADGELLAAPVDYYRTWGDWGSGGDHDVSFWQPIAPEGYTCLGNIAQRNYDKPSTDLMRCIKSDVLLRGYASWVWDDSGSGADWDAGVWTAMPHSSKGLPTGGFISRNSHSDNGGDVYWVLNKDYINQQGYGLATDITALATAIAPRIWMYSGESYFPSSVEFFLANTHDTGERLVTNESLGCAECTDPVFLDGERPTGDYTPPNYVIVVPKGNGVTDLVYFQLYPYNMGKSVCIGAELWGECVGSRIRVGNHVGDWEHLTIRLQDGQPSQVYLSQHGWGETFTWGDSRLQMVDGHPVVYSAEGSHGLYSTADSHVYMTLPNGTELEDDTNAGSAWDSWNNLVIVDWKPVGSYEGSLSWLNYSGDWGNDEDDCGILEGVSGECVLNSGPSGPMFKNATNPDYAELD